MRTIENLVFKGGGVLGTAYAGSIEALHRTGILANIKGVAGTSAGSITAGLIALNYNSAEINEIVSKTNFKSFEDKWDPLRIVTKYGLYKGDHFLSWYKDLIKQKTGNENITFKEFRNAGFKDLKVFATDLNTKSIQEFSADVTPDVIVAESIRASMSIPLFFSAWKFSNGIPNDHIFVDGGTVYNYPINAFKDLSNTLGFFLTNNVKSTTDLKYDHILSYVKSLFQTLLEAQNIDFSKNETLNKITVKIDDFGYSATDFSITKEMEDKLFKSGFDSTMNYIKKMNNQVS